MAQVGGIEASGGNTEAQRHQPPVHSPARAVKMVARWLALGEDDALELLNVLSTEAVVRQAAHTDEKREVVLVLRVNEAWVAKMGNQEAANQVIDAIAAFGAEAPHPRVANGVFHVFRFASFEELYHCQQELLTRFPSAFVTAPIDHCSCKPAANMEVPFATTALIDAADLWKEDPFKFSFFWP